MRTALNTSDKKATNLSISAELLRQAKDYKINLSATLEQALTEIVKQKQRQQWLQDNQQAIAQYNQRVEECGSFSDGLRDF
ncbi:MULTISPECIES: type II toxin-antitoxin system CcdA family antitoxin [Methylomonas]|uniref:Acetoacetyl-CoA synthase n=2 Tax=Methylomonas TaxID=416 RepID=A0A126T715_9GAMM|nr:MULTISPECIES: type II toxin-antitoxin system CcdA family antitoxin [Methylomonas]AMK77877.1 acetoacetyl-CoA synthase [Methylomonas denitrificans]OAI04537.1 acetoacetyl-CoA synthase [Methylomonas methanica]TCV87049.1 antitoxin CcdA [Methylomonas methanica]